MGYPTNRWICLGRGLNWGSQPDQTLPAHTDYSHPLWGFAHAIMAQTIEAKGEGFTVLNNSNNYFLKGDHSERVEQIPGGRA